MYTGAGVVQARPGREAIEAQLARILAGNEFRRSERRRALLRWTVNRALDGNEDPIKEYEIGLAVFGKPKSWDPRLDPIVRVEFSRMRQKLREYYAGQGAADPILIEFPFRGYLPVFHAREAAAEQAAGEPAPATTEPSLWRSRGTIALALVLALLSGAGIFLASSRLRTAPPLPTVAVLPFKDLTPRGQSQYLSNGISEELTDLLAMAPDLRVIARTSAFHFQGKNTDVREIGRELGAGWVIEGSILSEGDRIRVLVELDRTADGARLWKSRYERAAKDLPGIEEEITQAVAGVLQVPLPPRREVAFDPGLDARDEFLKGVDAESKARPVGQRIPGALRADRPIAEGGAGEGPAGTGRGRFAGPQAFGRQRRLSAGELFADLGLAERRSRVPARARLGFQQRGASDLCLGAHDAGTLCRIGTALPGSHRTRSA